MSLLSLDFDKNFIYVIIYWLLEIIYIIVLDQKGQYFIMTNKAFIDEYIFMILYNISDLLAGFLVLYSKCVSKSKKKEKRKGRKKNTI